MRYDIRPFEPVRLPILIHGPPEGVLRSLCLIDNRHCYASKSPGSKILPGSPGWVQLMRKLSMYAEEDKRWPETGWFCIIRNNKWNSNQDLNGNK
jgi:hypothetical protein